MDQETQLYVLSGEITWEMVGAAIAQLYQSDFESETNKILIPILSPGGDVDASWSLYAALKNLKSEVITVANGRVYSAAIIPFLAGSRRYALPQSLFLFHPTIVQVLANEEKPFYKYREDLEGEKYDRLLFKQVLSTITTTASRRLINRLVHDSKSMFVTAEKAKQIGLITDIVTSIHNI